MRARKTQSIEHHKLYCSTFNNNAMNFQKHSNKGMHRLE